MGADITIVDEQDNRIGCKKREDLEPSDIYRVSALWVTNGKGEILLARRALSKSHDPGKWGPAVAGTVEEGEDYEKNIIKETREELGCDNIEPQIGPKERIFGEYNYFIQWFLLIIDKKIDEFVIDHAEVEEIKWFSEKELIEEIDKNPINFLEVVKNFLTYVKIRKV